MIAALGLVGLVLAGSALPRRIDADIPPPPAPFGDSLEFRDRELGTGTTLFVNTWVTRLFFDWYVLKNKNRDTLSI